MVMYSNLSNDFLNNYSTSHTKVNFSSRLIYLCYKILPISDIIYINFKSLYNYLFNLCFNIKNNKILFYCD